MLPQGQQPAGDGGDKQEGHAEVLYHEAATLLVCKMAFECRQKQRQPAEEEGDGADGALDQKAEGEPKSRTPEHVLAIRQIPFGKCPHGEGDEKGEAGIDPDPVAVHDEALHGALGDHRPECSSAGASTRLASRPVNSRVAMAHRAPTRRSATVTSRLSWSRARKGMVRM